MLLKKPGSWCEVMSGAVTPVHILFQLPEFIYDGTELLVKIGLV